jgi:outer membrane protein OmpA-like peptidoglycan-associated protein
MFSVADKKKKPIAATIQLRGPVEQQVSVPDGSKEPVKAEAPAGKYTVNVTAPGHLAQTREVQISEDAEMAVAFDLQPEPKKRLVIVKENKIEILQQVHFATGKATILADSHQLLAQVIDAIVSNDIKRIRVEGHTDNRGNKAKNLKLSQDRAAAVADHLVKSGIDRGRLETAGFGDTRPVAPNLTPKGRELNRRVEFIILER